MKQLFQTAVVIILFCILIVWTAIAANAACPVPAVPGAAFSDPELPPDFFDENCDGGSACPGRVFTDMPAPGHWSHLPIDWAVSRHITAGTTATTFTPRGGCTRAQAVTFLWRAAGSPAPQSASCPFLDVAENAYYRDAVLWASENGITYGTTEQTFSPKEVCKRAQIITFLWRAKGSPASNASIPYQDVADDAYYRAAVGWATEHEITSGTSDVTFSPSETCTRAQIVTFLYLCSRS